MVLGIPLYGTGWNGTEAMYTNWTSASLLLPRYLLLPLRLILPLYLILLLHLLLLPLRFQVIDSAYVF
jgi:hypothetical protein